MLHPYAAFLHQVQKPSRYLGGEYQEAKKDPATVDARVCLAFPDVYEIGMSHLGTKILYGILNQHPRISCERTFAPWIDCEAQIRANHLGLVTLESAGALDAFDVIGISLQYELTYTNVLNIIDLAGLPLRAADRDDASPLILCGGPTATHPEPLAPFIDAFFIGEAEEALPALVLDFAALRRGGVPRRERLIQLASRYPLYVPELYTTIRDPDSGFVVVSAPVDGRVPARPKRVWVADINRFPFPDDSPLPYGEAIFDRMAVEVARGCTEGCRFCQAGMIYRPVRERDPVQVIETLLSGVKKGGYDETSLTSLSTADYSCVTPLVKTAMAKLRDEKVSLSVSSLRAYGLNDDLLAEMATMRAGGLTFAPEAGTQRMRDVITKNVTEEDIIESAHRVFSRGFHRMKLYFMIGLPTETDEDVRGIVETAARVQAIGRRYQSGAMVTASVSTHVPKPHTPFQWAAMDSEAETARKQGLLAQSAQRLRVDLKMHENLQSHLEAVFSRGDRDTAQVLERAFHLGCRFDSWDDQLRMDLWDQAFDEVRAASGLEPGRYLGTIPVTAHLPWDHIDIDLEPGFLLKEYRKALKDRLSPPCGKPYKKLLHPSSVAAAEAGHADKLICYDCGVACDLDGMKDERLFYLRRMNAWTKPVEATPVSRPGETPDVAEAPPGGGKARRGGRKIPPTRISQGEGHRVRLRYTKLGRVAFLGHLDLARHLPRIFRRAGVELNYSVGFHPKPELSFGPALGLGIPSLAELLDVKLGEGIEIAELVRRLQSVTLGGIDWLGGVTLGPNDRAVGRIVARAELWAKLPAATAVTGGLDVWRGGQPIRVKRRGEGSGVGRMIDVRRAVVALERVVPGAADVQRALRRLEWDDVEQADRELIRFELAVSPETSAKPMEVIEGLWGSEIARETSLARVGLWARGAAADGQESTAARHGCVLDPLDVDALRRQAPIFPNAPRGAASVQDVRPSA
jgi:radical SAM family uncharacterized protein/radical SAM-linked protein